MLLNGHNVVNVTSTLETLSKFGRELDILDGCNHQSFRAIDGYGTGKFLVKNTAFQTAAEKVAFTINGVSRDVYVVSAIALYIANNTASQLYVVSTAEEKYEFSKLTVTRSYNVLDRKTFIANTSAILSPDVTAKTMKEIIADISGKTVTWNPTITIYPYDVFIQGMSTIDAIDKMCAAYGLLWTYTNSIIYIHAGSALAPPELPKVSDIQYPVLQPGIKVYITQFSVLDCCIKLVNSYRAKETTVASVGKNIETYMPYYYAFVNISGAVTNPDLLNSFHGKLRDNFNGISKIEDQYIVQNYFTTYSLTATPKAFEVTFGNYGNGSRTIYYSRRYPYLLLPLPEIKDRVASRWLGTLVATYKGVVPGFMVTPVRGLDGATPTTTRYESPAIYVKNIFEWNYGGIGALVLVEWDCSEYQWIATQQLYICPPAGPNTTPVTPPSPLSYGELIGISGTSFMVDFGAIQTGFLEDFVT